MNRSVIFVVILVLIHNVCAFNILAIVSMPLRSHYMAFNNLFRELAIRGHSVTVINNFPDKDAVPNLNFVNIYDSNNVASTMKPLSDYESSDSWYWHLYNYYRHIALCAESMRRDCNNLFNNENATAHYSQRIKYDVIFVEQFMGDCGLAYALALYDAPIIGITSHTLLPWAYPRLGIPFSAASDAFYFSPAGPNPPLYNKIENYILNLVFNTFGLWYHHKFIYEVFDKHLPGNSLDVEKEARQRMKMTFAYQHFSLTGSRLLSPQVLEIAGLHVDQPKAVPEAIEKFLSTAEHGVIYVSFGSNLKASSMTDNKRQQFLNAFKNFKQKVIWKHENASFTAADVYTDEWMPQLDILCHPKVLAFVTHGGMLGMSESAYCGKPMIVVPFFGDQYSNAAAARTVGFGKVLNFDKLNARTLTDAIQAVLMPEMQENAKMISKLWRDRPLSVMDSAIYWTEYVARHAAVSPSPLPSQYSTWFAEYFIDVAIVILVFFLFLIWTLKIIMKLLQTLFLIRNFTRNDSNKPKSE